MIRKTFPLFIIVTSLVYLGISFFNYFTYVNKDDSIRDDDEKLIKKFRSHHDYTPDELQNLEVIYLDEIDAYRIYLVEYQDSTELGEPKGWEVEEYSFPTGAETRIIGIKDNTLFVFGKLVYETNIDKEKLYRLVIEASTRTF